MAEVALTRLADLWWGWRAVMLLGIGAVAALGQAPWGLWPLTILGLALFYGLYLQVTGWRAAAFVGWLVGTGHFLLAFHWITEPFMVDAARHGWMAPFALLGLAAGMALYWGAGLALARVMGGGAMAFVAWLGLAEIARGWLFTGFPWAQAGHALIDTPLLHWASYLGAPGLLTLILAAAVALWHMVAGAQGRGALALAGMAALWPLGVALTPEAGPEAGAPVIRLVQPNAPQHEKWKPERARAFLDRQRAFTAADEVPDLVVWPETAVPVWLNHAGETLEAVAASARGAPVVLGIQRFEGRRIYNSLAVVERGGVVNEVYDKHHLVPFGEFMPFGDFLAKIGIYGLASNEGQGYSAGSGAQLIDLGPLGRALPLICYESVFARDLRAAPGRADMILLITNDAWFGQISGPYQHLAQASLRSAEMGLPMIRVANTGVSAMIDATGRITEAIPLGDAGWRDAVLPRALPETVYARFGDAPMLALYALLLALSLWRNSARGHR
ncbi:apolipoprotein N-acyltransferase [Roseovarius autotrophicus]|uniref:apolipoprotein N-acyltransferase n=1 Tax=Roseovarius autotrophicus TaxID=2824121 RepID=UPI001A108DB4|nr:apolipoprotein N-acyltransferase [Roseovarius autotrophicus]MBE0454538.1 apolipoprotein N-acyltransferase [Roseovarius sp.]